MAQQIFINFDVEDLKNARCRAADDLRIKKFSQLVAGDSIVYDLFLTGSSGLLNIQDYAAVRMGIGNLNSKPESGSYTIEGTQTLQYNHSAGELETAIETVTGNGCDVVQLSEFVFKVSFDSAGSQASLAIDSSDLVPDSSVSVTVLTQGGVETEEVWLWRIYRNAIAFTDTFTNITGNGIQGTLSLATAGIYDLLDNKTTVNTLFEIELTDTVGDVQTIAQIPVKINGEVIGTGFEGQVPSARTLDPKAADFLASFPDPTFNDQLTISDATDNSFTGIGSGLVVGKTNIHAAENSVTIGENNNAGSTKNSLLVGETNETSQSNSVTLGNNNVVGGTGIPFATSGTIYDDFDYASGIYLYNATDGGQGFNNAWYGAEGSTANWRMTGTGRSLFFDQLSTSEYGLISDGSGHIWCEYSCQNGRDFSSSLPASSTYCTMLVRGYDGGASVAQMRIEFYSSTGATGNMRLNAGIDQGTLFVSPSVKGYSKGTTLPNAFQDGKTYLLAMKRTSSAVYASLIEADGDPSTLLSEPTWQIASSGTTGVSFQSIKLLGNNTNPNTGAGIRVDEIRIADSWEDAVDGIRYDEGSQSIAIGSNNYIGITTDAIAVGDDNDILGIRSYAIGEGLKDFGDDNTLLLGRFNEDPADDSKIVIANGVDDDDRCTAMEFKARTNVATNNSGVMMQALLNSPSYSNDSAASAGGVEVGELYRNGSTIRIRMT